MIWRTHILGNTHISVHPIISTFSNLTFQIFPSFKAAGLAKKSRGAGTNSGLSGLRRATRTDPVTMSSPSRVTPKVCVVSWAQERLVWCYLPMLKNVKHQRKLAKWDKYRQQHQAIWIIQAWILLHLWSKPCHFQPSIDSVLQTPGEESRHQCFMQQDTQLCCIRWGGSSLTCQPK